VGATLAGVDAPLCGISFLLASAGTVRQLRVLTLASLRGGYPNAFEGEPCLVFDGDGPAGLSLPVAVEVSRAPACI
jgi:hypothetical protein